MGAHHAPASARHAAPTSPPRFGRLAGTGVLTASAALAMTGAGGGVALAHDADVSSSTLSDNDVSLLCGILGGDECSSDADEDSDAGSSDDTRSLFDQVSRGSYDDDESDRSESVDGSDRSDAFDSAEGAPAGADRRGGGSSTAGAVKPASTGAPTQEAPLDTPPPPGQVRTIQVPG